VLLEAEALLMALAIGLYLYDSTLLLYFDEGIVQPAGRARWLVRFGSSNVRLMGKDLFFPNPLLPHRPLYRLSWRVPALPARPDGQWAERRALFRSLAPMTWGMALALFVLLPLGLFSRLGVPILLAALGLLYLSILAALVWVALHRARLPLPTKTLVLLAMECIVCPPFALNLVRTISLAMPVAEDLAVAARRLQVPADWNATRLQLIQRLEEEIDGEEEDSERAALLARSRRRLMEESTSCPA
jgi:hypothetical protein